MVMIEEEDARCLFAEVSAQLDPNEESHQKMVVYSPQLKLTFH